MLLVDPSALKMKTLHYFETSGKCRATVTLGLSTTVLWKPQMQPVHYCIYKRSLDLN